MVTALVPLATDPAASLRFGVLGVRAAAGEGRETDRWVHAFEERLARGAVTGRLIATDGSPRGIVCWSPVGPLGLSIDLLCLDPPHALPAAYRESLALLEAEVGASTAFVRGPLVGLATPDESQLMRSLGYAPCARSELVLQDGAPLPTLEPVEGERIRPVGPNDRDGLASVHRVAYHDRLDRYLFLEAFDEQEDAVRGVGEILDGRWGPLSPAGSWVAERDGRITGAVLSVQTSDGILIADVIVDPAAQGGGIGRRLLATTIRALRDAGPSRIYLNVTEGNERALRLYRHLGFERSLGPTQDWYNTRLIPVAPEIDR